MTHDRNDTPSREHPTFDFAGLDPATTRRFAERGLTPAKSYAGLKLEVRVGFNERLVEAIRSHPVVHGVNGFNHGCRCLACRDAMNTWKREARQRAKARKAQP